MTEQGESEINQFWNYVKSICQQQQQKSYFKAKFLQKIKLHK